MLCKYMIRIYYSGVFMGVSCTTSGTLRVVSAIWLNYNSCNNSNLITVTAFSVRPFNYVVTEENNVTFKQSLASKIKQQQQ